MTNIHCVCVIVLAVSGGAIASLAEARLLSEPVATAAVTRHEGIPGWRAVQRSKRRCRVVWTRKDGPRRICPGDEQDSQPAVVIGAF